jgi:hypothetical protein
MVRLGLIAGLVAGLSLPAMAQGPIDKLFPGKSGCYARSYSLSHLAKHPEQLVTDIALLADPEVADPMLGLWVLVELRGDIAGSYEGFGYCDPAGPGLACRMEGDAGSFTVTEDEAGAILIEVGRHGMSFEGEVDFITLMPDRGDDRSFLLKPVACP